MSNNYKISVTYNKVDGLTELSKLSHDRRKTNGFKPILVDPGNHTRLAKMTNKSQIYDDIITELLNKNMNAIVQTNPQVERPERFVLPSTKGQRGPKPNG